MKNINNQAGAALVTAILIVALASILGASLLKRLNLDISRTQNILLNEQTYLYTLSSEAAILGLLTHDEKKYDSLDEEWATEGVFPYGQGQIFVALQDLQGKFNLNNLSKTLNKDRFEPELNSFKRLLVSLELDVALANSIVDWLDTDLESSIPGGAEDDYYMALERPYLAANNTLLSPSELRLIKGFEEEKVYLALLPFISTLPTFTAININTAPQEVLKSLIVDLKDDDLDKIMQRLDTEREDQSLSEPFEDISEFVEFMKKNTPLKDFKADNMIVTSQYFLLTSIAEIDRARVTLFSTIERDDKGSLKILTRSQGAR